ncbi:hypothetical protein CHN56_03848 [Bacillus velezensis]|uniref:hypothetical protein n=1 Tax=Bacillus velezensis TaxID=492670 RepID=UPI000B92CCC8|nr:hypothetical protein [Bacillus velezensis]ASS64279.1 hypothetical protein CHN56_03848 [Bacillus velezensis]ATC49860.1 hypothetical protein CLI97_00523 [Bacillus velezensis]
MAKLNGVETLDMVNGEITKVAYGGSEYVKAEGLPKMGDLVRAEEGGYDITYGAFYKITDDADHADDVRFLDDVDFGRVRFGDDYELFRKVSTSTSPSLEERVSSAEGEIESLKSDVAALKGEAEYKRIDKSEAQDGDYIKFDEAPKRCLTSGKYYEIDYVDSQGDPWITDDDGDEFDTQVLCDDEFEVYRKVSASSVEVEPKPERLKVGDYAKVVENLRVHCAEIGEIVLVKIDDESVVPYKCEKLNGERGGWFYESELVRATDEEVAEAKDAAARAKFKRGDKVRLLSGGGDYPLSGFENDKIYEVLYNNFNHPKGKRIRIADSTERFGYATPDQLEILSEEEAAEIERKQAEEAKWAKIGRKVGEYKKGDIARVVDNKCAGRVANGDIIEVLKQASGGSVVDTVHGYFLKVELITPVEARFDR